MDSKENLIKALLVLLNIHQAGAVSSEQLLLTSLLSAIILAFPYWDVIETVKRLSPSRRATVAAESTSSLSPREKEVPLLLVEGKMNKEIAADLGVSEATVKNHVTSILAKTGSTTRTEAATKALREGTVPSPG